MSRIKKPILYIKPDCPNCREVLTFFNTQGVDLEICDVSNNKQNMSSMVSVSRQTKVPTFEYEEFIVADFNIDEFLAELREFPEVGQRIGIGDDQD